MTHKDLISTTVLYVDYITVTMEVFKAYIMGITDTNSAATEKRSLSALISELIVEVHAVATEIKISGLPELLSEFIDDISIKARKARDLSLSTKAMNILEASVPRRSAKHRATIANMAKRIEQTSTDNQKDKHLLQAFRRSISMVPKQLKYKNPLSQIIQRTFKSIAREDYYHEAIENEFEQLMEKASENEETSTKFKGFLNGLITYMQPKNEVEDDTLLIGLRIITGYLSSSKNFSGKWIPEFKSRQAFLVKSKLPELLCLLAIQKDDSKIRYAIFKTCAEFMLITNQQVQLDFKEEIIKVGSYDFFTKILNTIKVATPKIVKVMTDINSQQMLRMILEVEANHDTQANIDQINKQIAVMSIYLKFLQELCEGHNFELQLFMSTQVTTPDSKHSDRNIDFIEVAAELLKSIAKSINKESIELIINVVSFLTATLTGPCEINQQKLKKAQIIDSCRDILSDLSKTDPDGLQTRGFVINDPQSDELINRSYLCVVKLLMSLLENNRKEELLAEMGRLIDFKVLIVKITQIYTDYFTRLLAITPRILKGIDAKDLIWSLKNPVFDPKITDAFELFIFVRLIEEHTNSYTSEIEELQGLEKHAYDFFMHNTGSIEIIFHGNLQKVYFPLHPSSNYLSLEAKDDIMSSVRRDSENEKVGDFVSAAQSLFNNMDYTFKLRTKFKINPKYIYSIRTITLLICVLVNLYLFVFSTFKVVGTDYIDDKTQYHQGVVKAGAIAYIVVSSILLILYAIGPVRMGVLNSWSDYFTKIKNLYSLNNTEREWLQHKLEIDIFDYTKEDYYELIRFKRLKEGNPNAVPFITKLAMDIQFTDAQFFIILFYVVCYISGLSTADQTFYSLPLLDALNMFETLKVLSKSITYNGRQILLATALMVIIVYIYSLYAYYFVLDTFWNDAFDGGENQCTSVRHCFFTIFSLGPRSSGSVGDVLTRQSYLPGNKTKYYSRYIFDLSIFVVVNVMGMNIIFGIIIQTFAQLRDMMNVKTNDMLNICFVCSLDRNEIDKTIEGFDYHIAHDHHVWNYLYFMYYLRRKDPTLYCGLETSVANRIYKDDLSWFPFGKCMKLSTIESEETTEQLVEDACKRLEAITKMYKQAAKNQRSSTQNATGVESPRKSVA